MHDEDLEFVKERVCLKEKRLSCVGKVKSDGLPIRQAPQIYRKTNDGVRS
jgi:hypothetical protein